MRQRMPKRLPWLTGGFLISIDVNLITTGARVRVPMAKNT